MSPYRALHLKEINIVHKWPWRYSPLNKVSLLRSTSLFIVLHHNLSIFFNIIPHFVKFYLYFNMFIIHLNWHHRQFCFHSVPYIFKNYQIIHVWHVIFYLWTTSDSFDLILNELGYVFLNYYTFYVSMICLGRYNILHLSVVVFFYLFLLTAAINMSKHC